MIAYFRGSLGRLVESQLYAEMFYIPIRVQCPWVGDFIFLVAKMVSIMQHIWNLEIKAFRVLKDIELETFSTLTVPRITKNAKSPRKLKVPSSIDEQKEPIQTLRH